MIELLLAAVRFGEPLSPGNWKGHRVVYAPGAFTDLIDRRPPVLRFAHRIEEPLGVGVGWGEVGRELRLVVRTAAPALVRPIVAGCRHIGGVSIGTHILDSEPAEDDDGPVVLVHSAHLHDVSLVAVPGCRGAGIIGWRLA